MVIILKMQSSSEFFYTCYKTSLINMYLLRIGIAIGPRTWFGTKFENNISYSGIVTDNQFGGAFSYAIAITSAQNFTVQNNLLTGNTSFIGARGPNCSDTDTVPTPAPFVVDPTSTGSLTLQSSFNLIPGGDSLTCVLPPNGGDFWPFGTNPSNTSQPTNTPGSKSENGRKAGIAVGVIVGFLALCAALWFIRRWAAKRAGRRRHSSVAWPSRYAKGY